MAFNTFVQLVAGYLALVVVMLGVEVLYLMHSFKDKLRREQRNTEAAIKMGQDAIRSWKDASFDWNFAEAPRVSYGEADSKSEEQAVESGAEGARPFQVRDRSPLPNFS